MLHPDLTEKINELMAAKRFDEKNLYKWIIRVAFNSSVKMKISYLFGENDNCWLMLTISNVTDLNLIKIENWCKLESLMGLPGNLLVMTVKINLSYILNYDSRFENKI